jgi:sulfite exporter TauE/SafE/copper chaperone CopZ
MSQSHRKSSARTRSVRAMAMDAASATTVAPEVIIQPADAGPVTPAGTSPTTQTVVPVAGMTCRSCEVRIERNIRRIPNVERVSASATSAKVTIISSGPIRDADIADAIEAAGYEVGRTPWLERDPEKWVTASAGLIVLGLIAVVAKLTGIADLASGAGDLSQGGVVVALLLGLAAGVSTCMALAGGIVLALSASNQARRGTTEGDVIGRMRPAVVFVAGRIVGYTVFGAALGALGSTISLPAKLTAVLMIVVAVVMTLVGTRLTGLSPRVAAWSPTLPVGFARSMGLTNGTTGAGAYSDGRAALLGALSFFLPCGFTQAVQIYALSTGSPATAAILLGAFAIGTAPGLLGIAGLPAIVPTRWRPDLLRIVGVVVIGFAVLNATSGLRLAGIGLPGIGPSAAAAAGVPQGEVAITGDAQTLNTVQDLEGYKPQSVTIYAGVPTRWIIESTNAQTCASFLQIPDLGITKVLKKGTNEIDLPALPAGTLNYSCSMGMYGGSITIVDPPTGSAGGASGG